MNVLKAPADYLPNVDTDFSRVMVQTFKGGRVIFRYYLDDAHAEAYADGVLVDRWNTVTVDLWADILYSLEQNFSNLIEQ